MKYCRNCGKELNSDVQYCPNCGASVSEEQSGKNENSYQESNADGSLWESLVEFFKALIEYMKEAGLHIIDAIDKIIQMPPNIPKDSICPYCNSEDTFPIVKNETEMCGLWTGAFRCPGGRTDHELYGGNLAAGQTEERAGM